MEGMGAMKKVMVVWAMVVVAAAASAWDTNCKNAWAGGTDDDEPPWTIHPVYLRDVYRTIFYAYESDKMDDFEDSWAADYAAHSQDLGYHHFIMLYFESSLGVKWLEANARFAAKLESANVVGIWAWTGNGAWSDALANNGGGSDPPLIKGINVDDYLIMGTGREQVPFNPIISRRQWDVAQRNVVRRLRH